MDFGDYCWLFWINRSLVDVSPCVSKKAGVLLVLPRASSSFQPQINKEIIVTGCAMYGVLSSEFSYNFSIG